MFCGGRLKEAAGIDGIRSCSVIACRGARMMFVRHCNIELSYIPLAFTTHKDMFHAFSCILCPFEPVK